MVVSPREEDMRGPLDLVIAKLIKRALADCKQSREIIAAKMTEYLGRPISKDSLDAWASPAKSNRPPLDAFAALIYATGDMSLLGWMPAEHGYVVVPAKYADLIELHLLEERESEISRRKQALTARYKGGRS
ncbi:MAG: hypothetical protein B7Z41_03840 [Rhizobiales bacterium 12-66-7]|nr:MAG: hypothetical protein B7Z41_03840 [Rhizobiales bacterium 12-66-7]